MDRYEIQVAGHLDRRRATSLGCDGLRTLPGGDSRLTFLAVDRAALYGLLTRLRDAGLELIAVERTQVRVQIPTAAAHRAEPPKEPTDAAD
jgi:hypothetical protein